jgi:two-component system sensor histidine kinase VicK
MSYESTDATSLQFLANNIRQAIFIYEVKPKQFTFLNPAFEQVFNMTKESAINARHILEMIHPGDRQYVVEAYHKMVQGKESKELEFRINLPEQDERWVCLTHFLLGKAPGEERIVGYVEDVTASKRYNDYLKKFANKKDSVLHILAHDLAGPLAIIQSLSGALAEEAKPYGSHALDKLINLIERTSRHGITIIEDLTANEFLETTGVDLIKRRANLAQRLEEVMEQYQKSERKIAKAFRFSSSGEQVYMQFDDLKLMQALNNLISNAIKFTPEGGVITVSLKDEKEAVLITVEDNGIGIPKKYHSTLFDKFTNARRPGLDGEPSTGLGMSIIKTIVDWHQGHIWFESEENKGTTFFIELPKE